MKKLLFFPLLLLTILFSCQNNKSEESYYSLKKGFENPPLEARPRALWDWVDGNFELSEITNEMQEAKRMGLGGFDIWDVWSVVDEEHKITPGPAFMSDSSLLGICHAINEAERLDFDLGLIIASGWNAGGPWTLPENQTMGIFHSDTLIKGGSKISLNLRFPEIPGLTNTPGKKSRLFIPVRADGKPQFFKTIAVLAIRQNSSGSLSPETDVIDLSSNLSGEDLLTTELPVGFWKIDWSVCTNTGEPMIASTPNSKGPMIDHFNPEASIAHINFFINKLEKALGKPIGKSGLSYFYTDSYEVKGNLWTPSLPEEFMKRKGYSLIPYLPVLDGQIVADSGISARFRFDFQQVLSDLIIESHYAKTREISEAHSVGFVAEAAGPGMPIHNCPFESLKSSGALTFPRGEFWHMPSNSKYWKDMLKSDRSSHYLNDLQVIKGVASASHIYNQRFVEAESFTGTHLWNEGPGDLKPTLDRALCEGLNRVIFHTWPHTPKNSGKPGWVYSFGNIINENLIWWPMAKPFMDYVGRSSYLLQQGNFVGDILFYYGDAAPNFAPPKSLIPGLGFGYDYDYINTEIILRDLTVENGILGLPNGQKYKALVLPDSPSINPVVLAKIIDLLKQGAIIAGPKPEKSHSLQNWQANDSLVKALANDVWADLEGKNSTVRSVEKGHLYWGMPLKDMLLENNILPDVAFTGSTAGDPLDYIHRSMGSTHVYFIRNTVDEIVSGSLKLRATGQSVEVWNPESGETSQLTLVNTSNGITEIPVTFEALESRFIVISDQKPEKPVQTWDPLKYKNSDPASLKITFTQKWTIDFPAEWKGPGIVELDSIVYWNLFAQDNIRFFSGIASYENFFELTEELGSAENRIELSLTELSEVAEVYVNEKYAGTIWHKPFKLDVSKYVKQGKNQMQIKVANTWANRLCGDARLPVNERISNTNIVRLPNAWSYLMKVIPLDEYPLINSGISGEISLTASPL